MSDFTEFKSHNPIDMNALNAQGGVGMVGYGPGDESLLVAFYPRPILMTAKSQEAGKPVYERRDYITIQQPGEKLNKVDRPSTDFDKARFPRQWAAYSQNKDQSVDGVPLSLLFPSHPEIVANLNGYNITVVEQLARLSAHAISTVGMGAQEWVNKAQSYMKQAEKGVPFHQFNKMNEEKDQKIATLERQIAEISGKFAQLMSASVSKPVPVRNTNMGLPDLSQADPQTLMINGSMEPQVSLPPAKFSNEVGARRGRPKGSKNKQKEIL